MKTQLKIAVAVAVLSLAGVAGASEHVDLGTAQQRAEQGLSPTGLDQAFSVNEATRPTTRSLGEAQQIGETGEGYTPARSTTDVAGAAVPTAFTPIFGIGEAQQIAETGEGYTTASRAGSASVVASVAY